MSSLQNFRDKIFRKNGEKFSRDEVNPEKTHENSCNLSRLLKNNEIMRVEGTKNHYKATDLLKIRKQAEIKVSMGKDLPGWREVTPNLFTRPAKGQIYSIL